MSLNKKDKENIQKAIIKIAKIIQDLEISQVDPRVLDMLEICGSLLEQQMEMDMVFEQIDMEEPNNEIILYEQADNEDNEDNENNEVIHVKFIEDKDIPSPEDLQNWFDIGD